ncbi:MAG: virulence factor [Ardenticatenaceae bacterium]|nr:virulence factor [Ardenticatenaceae bacterium]
MKTTLQIMYWSDIPVQVKTKRGRARLSKELPKRFQIAVDKAAMEAGLIGSDDYTDQFHWSDPVVKEGDLETVAQRAIEDLDRQYKKIDWHNTVKLLKERGS